MTRFNCIRPFAALALCLALALLALPGRAAAADRSLTMSFQPGGSPAVGVEFKVYQVGQWDGKGGFDWLDSLEEKQINWDDLENLAATLAPYAGELTPAQTGKTGQDGTVTFSNLAAGAYLVTGEPYRVGRTTYTPSPVLISLPSGGKNQLSANVKYEEDYDSPSSSKTTVKVQKVWSGQGESRPQEVTVQLLKNGAVYDTVTLNDGNSWRHTWTGLSKSATWQVAEPSVPEGYTVSVSKDGQTFTVINTYTPPEEPDNPSNPDQPDNPDTPDNPDNPDQPDNPDNPDNPTTPTTPTNPTNPGSSGGSGSKPTLPQTGQLWWPVPLLACGGMVCFLAGWVKNRRDYES